MLVHKSREKKVFIIKYFKTGMSSYVSAADSGEHAFLSAGFSEYDYSYEMKLILVLSSEEKQMLFWRGNGTSEGLVYLSERNWHSFFVHDSY